MLTRYGKNNRGKRIKVADIFTSDEHCIDFSKIDKDALAIIRRLKHAGFEAYIVGGAVRDLLLKKKPKDFDIVTDAHPRQIKKIFRNARIIGKRFRLVHIHFGEKIIEVSTFRALSPGDEQNIFGTMEDDVKRRDFSFNALYYSPIDKQLIDYVGGYKDILNSRISSLIPLEITFKEDPVRLIRTIKYAATTGFIIPPKMKKALKKYSTELKDVSISRITEEFFKILGSGSAKQIFLYCMNFNILKYIVPVVENKMCQSILDSLDFLDSTIAEKDSVERNYMLYCLTKNIIPHPTPEMIADKSAFKESFKAIKEFIAPLTPPNAEVEKAVVLFFKAINIPVKCYHIYTHEKLKKRHKRGKKHYLAHHNKVY